MCDKCPEIDGEFKVTGTFTKGSVAIRIEAEGLPREAITYGLLTAASELVEDKDDKPTAKPDHDDVDAQAESFADFIMDKLFGEVWRKSPANRKNAKEPATASA